VKLSERGQLRNIPETRELAWVDAELRMESGAGGMRFQGYASVFDSPYSIVDAYGQYTETVSRSAFEATLAAGADVVLLVNHDGAPLARTKSGTMTLRSDGRGLLATATLDPSNPRAQELKSMVDRADLDSMSFTFRDLAPSWNADYTQRSLRSVDLNHGDVSCVNFPANDATKGTVAMRSRIAEAELRAKYTDKQVAALGAKGQAFKDPVDGHYSFPCADAVDIHNAVIAVAGRGGNNVEAIRRFIIKRAAALGCSNMIPGTWTASGTLKQSNAAGRLGERRSPLHANVSGSHTHRHPANQSQGSWKTHTHEHAHDGDASHTHDHDALAQAAADADAATDQGEDPTETMSASSSLSASEWDFEARVRIAKAKVALADASHLTLGERWALGLYDDLEQRLARRVVESAELRNVPLHKPMTGQHSHAHSAYNVQASANAAANKRPTGVGPLVHQHSHTHGANGVPDSGHDHDHGATPAGSASNVGAKTNQIADKGRVSK
jgi:HK97 family phage prohead protease